MQQKWSRILVFFAAIKAFSRKRFLVKTAKKAEDRPLSSKSGARLGSDCFVLDVRCCVLFAANLMMEGKSLARVEGEGGAIDWGPFSIYVQKGEIPYL